MILKMTRKLLASLLVLLMTLMVPAIALAGNVEGGEVTGNAVTIGTPQSVTLSYTINGAVGSRSFSIPTSVTLGANGSWTWSGSQSVNASNTGGSKVVTAPFSVTVATGAPSGARTFSVPFLVCGDTGSGAALTCQGQASVTVNVPVSNPPTVQANVSGTQGANGWYTSDVTVTWTVTGATTSTGCGPTTIQTDTAGTDVTCSASNAAGTTTEKVTIKRDTTAPSITASAVYADDNTTYTGGWTNRAVKVNFSCSDATSGISGSCPGSDTLNASDTVMVTIYDMAGNSAQASYTVQIDKILPTITASAAKADGLAYTSGTWTNKAVTVSYVCGDEGGSGLVGNCAGSETVSDGVKTVGASIKDNAGNEGFSNEIDVKIDLIAPTITMTAVYADTETPYTGGWTNRSVEVSFSCGDQGGSGLVGDCPDPVTISDSAVVEIPDYKVVDAAGNESELTAALTVQVDKEAPEYADGLSTTFTVEAKGPDGAVFEFSIPQANDNVNVVSNICDYNSGDLFPLGSTAVTCTARDAAGNETEFVFDVVVVDTTAPTLTLPNNMTVLATSGTGTVVTFPAKASDVVDGDVPVTCTAPSGSTFGLGTHTVICTAADAAGNTGTAQFTVKVELPWGGVNLPGNRKYKQGSTTPVTFSLPFDWSGATAHIAVESVGSNPDEWTTVEAQIISTSAATTGTLFRYGGDGQYIYNLSTKNLSVNGTYRIKVTLMNGTDGGVKYSQTFTISK